MRAAPLPPPRAAWPGVSHDGWTTSLSEQAYSAAVADVRRRIARGDVYQVNVCRMLSAPLRGDADPLALAHVLSAANPAPYAAVVCLPGTTVVSASPELFLRRRGRWVESAPIKGTGVTSADLEPKDTAENVMIVDLVRNDLGRVAETGTVTVPSLLAR